MSGASDDSLSDLRRRLREFVEEREWSRFHDPKNLAMAIASEAGELLAELRWVMSGDADSVVRSHSKREKIEHEVGDVLIALLLFCERAGIDLVAAANKKLELNAKNYPAELSKGRSDRPVPHQPALSSELEPFARAIAVDWSGEQGGGRTSIWIAIAIDGQIVELESGRSREEVISHLISLAEADPNFVVGLDFAFGLPRWFSEENQIRRARDLWALVSREGETWLRDCRPPFWGRAGTTRPDLPEHFRETDASVGRTAGAQAKSVFQINGAGSVGTGSLRGMPTLARLADAGFSIWPFDAPRAPLVVEIYPRLLTGPVVKSKVGAREQYLADHYPALTADMRTRVASTEDAFDAAVSALVMWENRQALTTLSYPVPETTQLEGAIWAP